LGRRSSTTRPEFFDFTSLLQQELFLHGLLYRYTYFVILVDGSIWVGLNFHIQYSFYFLNLNGREFDALLFAPE
jgi:hypothetical protein